MFSQSYLKKSGESFFERAEFFPKLGRLFVVLSLLSCLVSGPVWAQEAAEKPAEAPAEKPAEKPAEPPAEKPEEKPAEGKPLKAKIYFQDADPKPLFEGLSRTFHVQFEGVDAIKGKYPDRKIILYPDATGRNRTTNTVDMDNTNHAILRKAGFNLVFDESGNPPIEDRTTLINMKIQSMGGEITFHVHERCVNLINSLRQRQYKNGVPEKDNVTDHGCDCMDYVVWHLFNTANSVRQYSASVFQPPRRRKYR